jgi:hypothetical protein
LVRAAARSLAASSFHATIAVANGSAETNPRVSFRGNSFAGQPTFTGTSVMVSLPKMSMTLTATV